MSEENQSKDKGPWWKELLRRSSIFNLPWKQVCQKKVLPFILAPALLGAMVTVPQMAVGAYHSALSSKAPVVMAVFHAFAVAGLGIALWAVVGLELIFLTAIIWQCVLDLAKLGRAIGAAFRQIPYGLAKFLSWLQRVRQAATALPSRIRGMNRQQWFSAIFTVIACLFMAGLLYLGWAPAAHLAGRLPSWLLPFDRILATFVLDWLGSLFVLSFILPCFVPVIRWLFSWFCRTDSSLK